MVRLYATTPNSNSWKFTNIIGVLAVVNDTNMKGHFLRVVDVKVMTSLTFLAFNFILINIELESSIRARNL